MKHSHCSYCGRRFEEGAAWPRACAGCGNVSYLNPLPVAVLLLPVGGGLLVVRRAIPPRQGQIALPGGFINHGESWQAAAARELFEEAQVVVDPAEIAEFRVRSAPDGTVLIFGLAAPRAAEDLPPFAPCDEVSERLVIDGPAELAFPLHTEAAIAYFERAGAGA